jgi:hypothetical protein
MKQVLPLIVLQTHLPDWIRRAFVQKPARYDRRVEAGSQEESQVFFDRQLPRIPLRWPASAGASLPRFDGGDQVVPISRKSPQDQPL